ncbi:MAG: hypothetical protein ABH824_05590 [Nanoarchaeota archaeon]|nr:hypothetical protein [Nanoarchaeota archaeon]MBU1632320.1 hypothetical protein [Nanoarchaeota archaeon]MBU1875879.1 hypothetical protein [Nanoarchaeota archaeon]
MAHDFSLAKCKTKATYSAKLKKRQKLDLNKIGNHSEIILKTPILLVIKLEGIEIIVHSYGELLFKNCDDFSLMEKLAEQIYSIGLKK